MAYTYRYKYFKALNHDLNKIPSIPAVIILGKVSCFHYRREKVLILANGFRLGATIVRIYL